MTKLRIDVWSDIACPWCYIGKRRLEAALERFAARDQVEVVWRAFELDPAAPRELEPIPGYAARLARKYRCSVPQARAMIARVAGIAKGDGLDFDFERIRPGNTFDAHRVLHLARARGVQDAVEERLLRGYLCEGEAIGDPATLQRLGAEAGLDVEALAAVLASDDFAAEVREDEAEASAIGITGVPFFVLGGRYAVSGAQPADLLLGALTRAHADVAAGLVPLGEGAACGPDGC